MKEYNSLNNKEKYKIPLFFGRRNYAYLYSESRA